MLIACTICRQPMPATKQIVGPDRCVPLGYALVATLARCPHCGALTHKEDEDE